MTHEQTMFSSFSASNLLRADSLCIGGKKISVLGLVFFQWYKGVGFPSLDTQLRVTFPFRTGVPITEQLGGDGGTATRTGDDRQLFIGYTLDHEVTSLCFYQWRY